MKKCEEELQTAEVRYLKLLERYITQKEELRQYIKHFGVLPVEKKVISLTMELATTDG